MTTEQQDLVWAWLSKEERDRMKIVYKYQCQNSDYNRGFNEALEEVFNSRNLTSDTEPEEILMVERKKVIDFYNKYIGNPTKEVSRLGLRKEINILFGDKCLPDKENTPKSTELKSDKEEFAENANCKEPSVQVEPKFKPNDEVYLLGIDHKHRETILDIIGQENGEWVYHLKNSFGGYAEHNLEPYTEPEIKDNMEEKEISIKEKYWQTGNIFEMSTGNKRLVWENQLIDSHGFIPKIFFNDNLVNADSTIGEHVIRVYSPNNKAGYFEELIETEEERLIWQKYDYIFTKSELKQKLGISEENDFIIIEQ